METGAKQGVEISVEQAKLLGSAQRVKIIGTLADTAKTAKQVADELGESPGGVHYHIQKLFDGGLIDLVESRTVGGIVEKYYKARAKWFNTKGTQLVDPVLADDYDSDSSTTISLRMQLSPGQLEQLTAEIKALFEKWVSISIASNEENAQEYAIGLKAVSVKSSESSDRS